MEQTGGSSHVTQETVIFWIEKIEGLTGRSAGFTGRFVGEKWWFLAVSCRRCRVDCRRHHDGHQDDGHRESDGKESRRHQYTTDGTSHFSRWLFSFLLKSQEVVAPVLTHTHRHTHTGTHTRKKRENRHTHTHRRQAERNQRGARKRRFK